MKMMRSFQQGWNGMLNLDTHILVDSLAGMVSRKEKALLAANQWCISGIVLWEIAKLNQLGRIELDVLSIEFSRALSQITVIPLSPQICEQSTTLDFRSDPADELIAATSIVCKTPLLTRDKKIRKSKLVPFAVA